MGLVSHSPASQAERNEEIDQLLDGPTAPSFKYEEEEKAYVTCSEQLTECQSIMYQAGVIIQEQDKYIRALDAIATQALKEVDSSLQLYAEAEAGRQAAVKRSEANLVYGVAGGAALVLIIGFLAR